MLPFGMGAKVSGGHLLDLAQPLQLPKRPPYRRDTNPRLGGQPAIRGKTLVPSIAQSAMANITAKVGPLASL